MSLFALVIAGCGIETVPYLYPVNEDKTDYDTSTLSFQHADDNGATTLRDYFRGYVLYYRFYLNNDDGIDEAESDYEYIVDDPISPDTDRLEDMDYLPFIVETDELPHLTIDAQESSIVISLDVLPGSTTDPKDLIASWTTDDGTDESVILRRYSLSDDADDDTIDHETAEMLWSESGFETTDYDIETMLSDESQDTIESYGLFMVIYVLSFGIDGTFNSFFSEPARIYGGVDLQ